MSRGGSFRWVRAPQYEQHGQSLPNQPPGAESGQQPPHGGGQACQQLSVGLLSGPDESQLAEVEVRGNLATSGLPAGDRAELFSFLGGGLAAEDGPAATEANLEGGDASDTTVNRYELAKIYEVGGIVRHLPLAILALLFVGVVIAVGRLRGFFAILALGVAAGVLLGFVLPAPVAGGPALLIGLVASSAIMFVTLFFVHGVNMRTTSAFIGTLAGVVIISSVSCFRFASPGSAGLAMKRRACCRTWSPRSTSGACSPARS